MLVPATAGPPQRGSPSALGRIELCRSRHRSKITAFISVLQAGPRPDGVLSVFEALSQLVSLFANLTYVMGRSRNWEAFPMLNPREMELFADYVAHAHRANNRRD